MEPVPDPGELTLEQLETELAEIKRYAASRDGIVRAAHAAGMNPHQIHKLSGIGRTTVYRILGLLERGRGLPKSPIELYEASGKSLADAPPRTQEILRLAEESHNQQKESQ